MTLREHIHNGASRPMEPGVCDCSLWVADWVLTRTGVDPMLSFRGTYRTEAGALATAMRNGGVAVAANNAFSDMGLKRTKAPKSGDVGLIYTTEGLLPAICTDDGWAIKAADGVWIVETKPATAWEVC